MSSDRILAYSRMPVQLSHSPRFQNDVCRGDGFSDWKIGRVGFPPNAGTAWCRLRRVRERAIYVGSISDKLSGSPSNVHLPRRGTTCTILYVWVRLG